MFRRRSSNPASTDASTYSRRRAAADSLWSAQDRLRSALATSAEAFKWPFERVAYGVQERLAWPLADRAATMGKPARALSSAAAVVLAAAAGIAGLAWAAPDKPDETTATRVAVTAPAATEPQAAPEGPAEPTLQGAAPVFEPAPKADASEVDPAKAIDRSTPAAEPDSPSPSEPAGEAGAAASSSAAGKEGSLAGRPAGPEALAVAREFADAFVLYETGNSDGDVRRALGETATPTLAKALLRRPPRLPANVEVPQAKVLNVVPAPSQGGIYPISVSLLRVGVTSELRLDMEQLKGDRWRVTNVLG